MGKREDSYNRRRLRIAYFTSVFSITLVLLVLGILGGSVISGKKLAEQAKQNLKLQVLLNLGTDEQTATEVKSFVESMESVAQVRMITPEQAIEEYKGTHEDDPLLLLDENPLPYTLEVSLKPQFANAESILEVESVILSQFPNSVTEVYKDIDLINDVNINVNKVSYVLLGICVFLSVIMIALINNTIRLAIFSKRFLIKTMQLVGATKSFIRKPFIRSGTTQGLIGSTISSVILTGLLFWINVTFPKLFDQADYLVLSGLIAGIFVLGLIISYASTRFAVQKFLRLKMDELY